MEEIISLVTKTGREDLNDLTKTKILSMEERELKSLNNVLNQLLQDGVVKEKRILNPLNSEFVEMSKSEGFWKGTVKMKNQNDFDLSLNFIFSEKEVKMKTSNHKLKKKATFLYEIELRDEHKVDFFGILVVKNKSLIKSSKTCFVLNTKWN